MWQRSQHYACQAPFAAALPLPDRSARMNTLSTSRIPRNKLPTQARDPLLYTVERARRNYRCQHECRWIERERCTGYNVIRPPSPVLRRIRALLHYISLKARLRRDGCWLIHVLHQHGRWSTDRNSLSRKHVAHYPNIVRYARVHSTILRSYHANSKIIMRQRHSYAGDRRVVQVEDVAVWRISIWNRKMVASISQGQPIVQAACGSGWGSWIGEPDKVVDDCDSILTPRIGAIWSIVCG